MTNIKQVGGADLRMWGPIHPGEEADLSEVDALYEQAAREEAAKHLGLAVDAVAVRPVSRAIVHEGDPAWPACVEAFADVLTSGPGWRVLDSLWEYGLADETTKAD